MRLLPRQIMSAIGCVKRATRDAIREYMSSNLCRCAIPEHSAVAQAKAQMEVERCALYMTALRAKSPQFGRLRCWRSFLWSGQAPVEYLAGGTTHRPDEADVMRPAKVVDLSARQRPRRHLLVTRWPAAGAMVTMSAAADHPEIVKTYPVISQSLKLAASAQLRNMATLGGNVLQRTRCPYFRDTSWTACNKRDPGSGCTALDGLNRQHAILGGSPDCIATYPGDFAQSLIALDATVTVAGPSGVRTIPFAGLHRLPGATPNAETVLAPGDLITGFNVPAGPWTRRSLYLKVRDRQSYEFALASAAVAIDMVGSAVRPDRSWRGGCHSVAIAEAEDVPGKSDRDRRSRGSSGHSRTKAASPQCVQDRAWPIHGSRIAAGRRTGGLKMTMQLLAPVGNMGQPIPRYDARAKVTGTARYPADMALPDVAYAYLLSSRIAKGRIRSFDLKAARALPGVLDILTYQTIGGDIRKVKYFTEGGPASNSVAPLGSAEIAYAGQTIAVVLAETLEVAQDAASQIGVEYEEQPSAGTFDSKGTLEQELAEQNKKHDDPKVGDFAAAYEAAPLNRPTIDCDSAPQPDRAIRDHAFGVARS